MQTTTTRLLLVLLAGLLLTPATSVAQAPAVATSAAPALATTAPQARQALDVLRDEKRRAELITTLEAIANSAAAPTVPAPTAAPLAATSKLPLEPDSLGAELITQVSSALSNAGSQLAATVRSVNDLPLLWRWLWAQANDPAARALALDAAWKLLVVIAAGLAIERGAVLSLRRLRAALSRAAEARPAPPPPPDAPPVAAGASAIESSRQQQSARSNRLTGALSAMRRLPFLVGRLLVDVLPIGLFAVLTNVLLGTWLGQPASTRGTILLVVQCTLAARVVVALSTLLFSPAGSQLRLLHISDWGADFLTRWVRRTAIVALTGYAVAGIGLQFGMYRTAYDALLKLFALVVHVCLVLAVLQAREPIARRIRPRHSLHGASAIVLNRLADIWHLIAIFYIVALWLVWAVELRNGYVRLVHFFVVTAGVMIASRLIAIVLLGGLDRARTVPALATRFPGFETRAASYYPILRGIVMAAIGVATALALLQAWGLGIIGWFQGTGLGSRAVSAILLIGTTVFLAVMVWEGVNAAIEMHLARLSQSAQLAKAGRLRTLLPMLRTVLLVVIVLVVALMSLDELGVNIAPLLAGAGVIGIAVGFGSQKLVQDLITGLFLLLENAMQVGDVVTLGGLSGTVEALSIRTIRLRALDGSVHIIPFSAVTTVTNQTRDYGYAVIDVSIGLNEEPERIIAVLKDAAEAMRQEPRWQNVVLEPLDIMGVEKFVDLAWVMRVRMKTQPSSRWAVARELNRRFKCTFDELGIESPFTSHRALSTIPGPPDPAPEAYPSMTDWQDPLRHDGFIFVRALDMQAQLEAVGMSNWDDLAASWDDLGLDTYMADGGRYRKRRHAAFLATAAAITRKPHQPHYQSRDYNALNGGIARWFEPVAPAVAAGPAFQAILRLCTTLFDGLTPAPAWHVEAHQFRIEARPGQAGQPTPEGLHQDGVDWVLVLMIGRRNIASGTTSIHGLDRALLGSFTLESPMDAALLDDHRVFHGVTPVAPLDPAQPAHRDVLVLTWRKETLAPV